MRKVLNVYKLLIDAQGPVFIGSGNEIQKKEYLFLKGNRVGIVDMQKLYQMVRQKHLTADFERFMTENVKEDLRRWLERNKISMAEAVKCMKYTLEVGDMEFEKGKRVQIMEFIKDPYGMPYVPGSSVKGMLRTILLGGDVLRGRERYRNDAREMKAALDEIQGKKRSALIKNIGNIENKRFHTLNRTDNFRDAVNDSMSGVIVSDSEPLRTEDLILCQKVERHADGREKTLNLLRECLRPGTRIVCTLTIDTSIVRLDAEQLRRDIAEFGQQYYDNFSAKFSGTDRLKADQAFLGGGSGFVSKTVIYPIFPGREGVGITREIFRKTGVPEEHKHRDDMKHGVSPHILKCTRYQGKSLQMGLCRIQMIPEDLNGTSIRK